ncbi:MAG: SusC/RagA family TonB-linked outer membrane protein [Bacteroidota bacterium]|nr:SusC/RagA family TonB-linked outer membrane protein [Bacteroidota bacterium]MDP4205918.1 SusC/RagA family TonB-linked outer membrane protein [Bacteroidota bacterium]
MKRKRSFIGCLRKLTLLCTLFIGVGAVAFAQKITIKGTVKDVDQATLPGVSVFVKGTTLGTVTDNDGKYSIVADSKATLVFTFIGMETLSVPVNGQSVLNVQMRMVGKQVEEVVVTALGLTRAKRALGYSQEQIKGNELVQSIAPNVLDAISGKMAGVNITAPNGVSGGTTRIIIDGENSILGDNQPLIIVDGMPMANEISSSAADVTAPKDWGSAINLINPQDIESMSVLKGPAAAALYGGRGANGVILITTKKGILRKGIGVEYNFDYKNVEPYRYLKMQNEYGTGGMVSLNAPQYQKDGSGNPRLSDGWTQMYVDQNTGTGPYGVDTWNQVSWPGAGISWGPKMNGTMLKWWDGSTRADVPQPNNLKSLYQNGMQASHNVAVSGGNEFSSVRASYTRLDNTVIFPNTNYSQNTFNLGASFQPSKQLNIQANVSYFARDYHNAPALGNDDGASWQKRLLYNVGRNYQGDELKIYKNNDGSRHDLSAMPWLGNNVYQLWNIMENNSWQYSRKLIGSIQANYKATDYLDFMFRGSIDNNNNETLTENSPIDALGVTGGSYSHGLIRDYAHNYDGLITLHKENIRDSQIDAKLSFGGTTFRRSAYTISAATPGTPFAVANYYYFANYTGITQSSQIPSEVYYDKKMNSLYSFINLSYKNFLYLDITGRNDWSSTLPAGNESYFYPSFTGSFIFSEVLKLPEFISFGKLRAAWVQGATDTDPYKINLVYPTGSFAGEPTSSLNSYIPALHYKPQINKTADFGINLGFLQNRYNLDVRYYKGRSSNQIFNSPLPASSGVTSAVISSGVLDNSGLDITVRGKIISIPAFKWDMSINYSHNSNRLISLSQGVDRVDMANLWGNNGVYISALVGHQLGCIMGYDYVYDSKTHLPILQDEAMLAKNGFPASMKGTMYETTQSSGKMGIIGNATPKFRGGMTNTFTFKGGISVSMLIDCRVGGQIWSGSYATLMQQGQGVATLRERDGGGLPYTTPDGTQTKWGVILPGVYPDGTVNTTVVHYYYKYMQYGVWSSGPDGSNWIHSSGVLTDTWFKMRELSINYMLPDNLVKKTKVFQSASVSLVGRDLFYIYSSLPANINPEGVNGAGNAQGIEFGSLPNCRTLGFQVRLSF